MPRIAYTDKGFQTKSLALIATANAICAEYSAMGLDLTLRQLYYQFVARGLIPNRQTEYDRLGEVVNNARLAGLLDWNYINDMTRNVREHTSWDDPAQVMRAVSQQYREDTWENQEVYVEVWVEKDALVQVVQRACDQYAVPYFSCRGYVSQSEMWRAARRIEGNLTGKKAVLLHLGDHDPSGIDMSRDIADRLRMFLDGDGFDPDDLEVRRIALTWDQVQQYNPPPNPAKLTDSRVQEYMARYGSESWELDALEPTVIIDLIVENVLGELDQEQWETDVAKSEANRGLLELASKDWVTVATSLREKHGLSE